MSVIRPGKNSRSSKRKSVRYTNSFRWEDTDEGIPQDELDYEYHCIWEKDD